MEAASQARLWAEGWKVSTAWPAKRLSSQNTEMPDVLENALKERSGRSVAIQKPHHGLIKQQQQQRWCQTICAILLIGSRHLRTSCFFPSSLAEELMVRCRKYDCDILGHLLDLVNYSQNGPGMCVSPGRCEIQHTWTFTCVMYNTKEV